ncbi:MAG: hypothetical protein PHD56_10050 [Anaerostipes sp.]|nr:hypothetical protein [Anaerostipes sp.]
MGAEGLGDLPTFESMDSFPKPDAMKLVKDQEDEEKDYQYMTKLYAKDARDALVYIGECCDQMEYEGSMMFHEYVDRTQMLHLADQVYQKMKDREKEECIKCESNLFQLIYVLLCGEVHHRRCRYRRKKCYLNCR